MSSQDLQNFTAAIINQLLNDCKSCGKCRKVCPFLDAYGEPYKIISESPQNVFLCTNCGACSYVCPQKLSPSDALFETKCSLIKEGYIPDAVANVIRSANDFARRGHSFPFSYYASSDTVFWPGCSLSGTSPEIVKKTAALISKQLNKKVELALDCCFDPLYQVGDIESVKKAFERIRERLKRNKVTHIITGCVNCTKILSTYLPEIKVEHILEILPENSINPPSLSFFLHHPCPSFRLNGIRQRAKAYLQKKYIDESLTPLCCGFGGGVASLSVDLSDRFSGKVADASNGSTIVTYCMGCKTKFLQKGWMAYHLLEFLPGVKPIEKPVSPTKKWANRLFLSMSQRFINRKLFLGLSVILLIVLTAYLRKNGYISTDGILEFLQKHKFAAPLFFIIIYTVGPSLFIPSLPLTLGAGFLWGPFWGVVFSITGSTLGASVAFLVARYLLGNSIRERFGYSRWKWLKEKVEMHGWKAVAFSRLVPVFPFPILNYLFGVTPIPFLHYLWSTFVFMLPACIAYVAFGSSMGEMILKGNFKGLITGIVIASAALLLPFALKPLIRKISGSKNEKSALGVFFRIPAPGKVKKRLAIEIGEDSALEAYKSMLKATINNVSMLQSIDIYGFYDGILRDNTFMETSSLIPQKGSDLGERMLNAIKQLLTSGYGKVSLIGADSPDLPLSYIKDAFVKLDSSDLVIGPSEDGGYYLIGMKKPFENIFKNIKWGCNNVLKDTISIANNAGISYLLLPQWYDIDDIANLKKWRDRIDTQ